MRTSYKTILILAMGVLLLGVVPCSAERKGGGRSRRMKLTEEKVNEVMEWLADKNPARAEELEQLREKDPEEFKAQVRRAYRRKFGRESKGRTARRRSGERQHAMPRHGMPGMPGMPGMGPGRGRGEMKGMGRGRERMREKHRGYIEWLEKNYPEEAEKLAQLREKKPDLYHRKVGLSCKKYRRIMEEENPKVAEVLKEDLQLKNQRDKVLRQLRKATEKKKTKDLTEKLEQTVAKRFDLIIKQKRLRYEELSSKLEKLKVEVKQKEAELQKDIGKKDQEVKNRLKELLEKTERLRWD